MSVPKRQLTPARLVSSTDDFETHLGDLDYKILDFLVQKFKKRPDIFFGHTPRSVARALRLPRDLGTRRAIRKILRGLASQGLLNTISVKPTVRYLPSPEGVAFVDGGAE